MNNQIDATITGIYLGGFQVFDEVNFIPLRRLTFFYGPNSSGKSAVEDALQLIQKEFFWGYYLTSYRESFLISYNEEKYLNENWRRVSEESDSYAPECTLGFQFISNGHLIKSLEVCGLETLDRHPSKFANYALKKYEAEVAHIDQVLIDYSAKYQRINLKENCVTSKGRRERWAFQRVLSMSVNGTLIAESKSNEYVQLNFKHPVLLYFEPIVDFSAISIKYPNIFQYENGMVRISDSLAEKVFVNSSLDSALSSIYKNHFDDHTYSVFDALKPYLLPDDLKEAIIEFAYFFNQLHNNIWGDTSFAIHDKVDASRKIPSEESLCFVKVEEKFENTCNDFSIVNKGDPIYEQLAWDQKFRDRVNYMFTDHLFIDRGYFVADEILDIQFKKNKIASIIRLYLQDNEKRRFSFNDVGSGIGYVLPVLCKLALDDHEGISFAVIQQPELHLHPALQSSLGDIFIERTCDKQIIVETHSEHILLRVLKRVRQTKSNSILDVNLQIDPNEIAIVYFDPSPSGITNVKFIRISEDGEFLDRWPHGFFAERDQDLFDE